PESCVFVSANAGSGKTSLLANRVLSLLLHGVEPAKILCLTFTNAAAAEMSSRILKALGSWVMADNTELEEQVVKLTGDNPNAALLAHARGLFASVLEAPQGVNIQTIHGFSQSLLRRFPLEAGVSPYFTVMDGRSEQEVLAEARLRLFNHAQKNDSTIQQSLDSLARVVSESSFHKLINEIVDNKQKFRQIFKNFGGITEIEYVLCNKFKISINDTKETLLEKYFIYDDGQLKKLRETLEFLLKSDKDTDIKTATQLEGWLQRPEDKLELIDGYVAYFALEDGSGRKRLFTKAALTDDGLIEALLAEQKRICEFGEKLRALNVVYHTMDVSRIAEALLAEYEAIKRAHAWMDYDDLIMTSCDLLTRAGMSPWVLFKLDGGIDHILVDEAQDTSPQQWQIVTALTEEFFAGQGAKEIDRSLFIVGDEKQSIFSFQGANVKELARMQNYFSEVIKAAQKPVHHLSLTNSYRSTEAILQTVDAVFANNETRAGVTSGDNELKHILTRTGHSGVVELWPLIQPSDDEESENTISPTTKLVQHIADTIKIWIENGEAKAGEVMILLRTRTVFADRLVRALKKRDIPVAGSDRMKLNDNLAVQDLIALGQVLLLPDDDLTLASCLKSPIFNQSEEDLFTLAYDRGKQSLWQRLRNNPKFSESYELLVELRAKADFIPPFELYSYLLDNCGARARFVGRMGEECADPLDEFMQQALLYERSHPPSLQGFIHWLSNSDSIIKRDMEQARDAVRIMTIHGAKGLQAKIVILPDTVSTPVDKESLLWLDDEIPIRSVSSKQDNIICKQLRANRQAETFSEYRRLLYVALTRAEDRLYVCGATGKEKISEKSWYHHIKTGMESIATPFETKLGEGLRVGEVASVIPAQARLSLSSGAILEREPLLCGDGDTMFAFLQSPVPAEPSPSKPLVPSRPSGELPASASPFASQAIYAVGKLIHLLLQYLPMQEVAKREESAKIIARKFASMLSVEVIDKAISDAIFVIDNPKFAFLFGKDALAEVPITGNVLVAGKNITVSGQIDRLYMGNDEVWIIDFKSNQLPPTTQKNIPAAYIRQLALYRLLLQQIAPKKTVYCALLWTANAKLDVLPQALLDEWQASSYI
ncbi:MAG: double-strand break repair helicase AddA, partial [Rickettsiales bacterium]